MKVVILAAGKGSRLGNLTENTPKCLLTINKGKETLLGYNLKNIARNKLSEILVVTGFQREKLERFISKWQKKNEIKIECIYNPFWDLCNVLGSLYCVLDKIDDDFIFIHADTLVESKVWMRLLQCKEDICLAVDYRNCGAEEMKVIVSNNRVRRISKQIDINEASGEFVGIAKFSSSMIPFIKKASIILFEKYNLNLFMEAALQYGIENKIFKITPVDVSDLKTIEVDFLEDFEMAIQLFGSKRLTKV